MWKQRVKQPKSHNSNQPPKKQPNSPDSPISKPSGLKGLGSSIRSLDFDLLCLASLVGNLQENAHFPKENGGVLDVNCSFLTTGLKGVTVERSQKVPWSSLALPNLSLAFGLLRRHYY